MPIKDPVKRRAYLKNRVRLQAWYQLPRNQGRKNAYARKNQAKACADLTDSYVRSVIWDSIRRTGSSPGILTCAEIPPAWVILKRDALLSKRIRVASLTPEIRKAEQKAYRRAHYVKNREKIIARTTEYHREHKDLVAATNARYRAKHPDKANYHSNHPDWAIEVSRRKVENMPDSYIRDILRSGTSIPTNAVPQWLVELHRLNLTAKRLLEKPKQTTPST